MFNPRRKSRNTSDSNATPLDKKQEALREKEEKLKQAADQLKRLIEDAPRMREEQTRRRREQLAGDTRLSRNALTDKRYDVFAAENPAFGTRQLRSEKRQGKYLFLVLLLVVGGLMIWVAKLLMANLL